MMRSKICAVFWVLFCAVNAGAFELPVPSTWEGEAVGMIHGVEFRVPVAMEMKKAFPYEVNPFHLFVGTRTTTGVGDLMLVSAMQFGAGGGGTIYEPGSAMGVYERRTVPHASQKPTPGGATLQYLTITREGPVVRGVLTSLNKESAAAVNGFTGPNVSAQEASPVMRGVLEDLGNTEMFTFLRGATLEMRFEGNTVSGSVMGSGRSVLNTSSDVTYSCRFSAMRVK